MRRKPELVEDQKPPDDQQEVKTETTDGQSSHSDAAPEPVKSVSKHIRFDLTKADVFFVEVKAIGSVSRQPKAMLVAFTSMKTHKFNPKWIKEEEVCAKNWSDLPGHSVFVLDSFSGKAFDHLLSKNIKIVGPLTVLYCFSSEVQKRFKQFPEKPHPVFSQCLLKCFTSISGFDGQRKQEMINRITQMCGYYSKDFTKRVTHLVSDSVRTKKYEVAKANGIPVLSSQWIDDCWTEHQHNLLDGANKDIVSKYGLKIFANLTISVSRIAVEERETVQKIVNENGGQYSPSLKLTVPDAMLLLRTPKGDKYKYAKLKGVPCLDVQWLYDSLEKGYALPEDKYVIGSSSQISNESISPTKDVMDRQNNGDSSKSSKPESTREEMNDEMIKRINELVANRKDETFLEGCDVYITGFDRQVSDAIRTALISFGAMVYKEFKDLITHVIYGPIPVESDSEKIFDHKSCKVMAIDCLMESLERGESSDKREYEIVRTADENSKKRHEKKIMDKLSEPLTVFCPKSTPKSNVESVDLTDDSHQSLSFQMTANSTIRWREGSTPTPTVPSQTLEEKGGGDEDSPTATPAKRRKT